MNKTKKISSLFVLVFLFCLMFVNGVFLNKTQSNITSVKQSSNVEMEYNSKTFSNYIKENNVDGVVDVKIDRNVNLSDFKTSNLNINTFDNDYAIHGYKNVTIDFLGHNVFSKTFQPQFRKSAGEFNFNKEKNIAQIKYPDDTSVKNKEGISFYYLYWFYGIDSLTLRNANFINVPFLAYDINHLTIENSVFSGVNVSNFYWGAAINYSPQDNVDEQEKFIGVITDQINNIDIRNVSISDYYIGQNIYNYSELEVIGQSTIALFSRTGNNANSISNFNNLSFYDIDFSLNERGLQTNDDVAMNFGLIQNLIGTSSFKNIYFDKIKFISNNDTNKAGSRQNSLISFDQEPINITLENIFVGRIFTSTVFINNNVALENSTWLMTMSFIYSDINKFSQRLNNGKIVNPKIDKSQINFITFTDKEETIELNKANLNLKNKVNYFVENEINGYNSISLNQAISDSFYFDNFNQDYFFKIQNEIPQPIILPTNENVSLVNKWSKIKFQSTLKQGYAQINSGLKVVIEIDKVQKDNHSNNDTLVFVTSEEYNFDEKINFKYNKPKKTRLEQHYFKIYLKDDEKIIPLNDPIALKIIPIPSYLYPTIISVIILIIAIILMVIIFFIMPMIKKRNLVTEETTELSEHFNQYHYDFNQIDEFYNVLNLPLNANKLKLQKIYNKKLKLFLKDQISREEFDKIHTSYLAISSYIDWGGE